MRAGRRRARRGTCGTRAVLGIVFAWAALGGGLRFGERAAWADARSESGAQSALASAATDYAGEHFQRAIYRLSAALRACAHERCAAATRAALWRDLGSVEFRRKAAAAASKAWARALALQAELSLNPAYDAADVRDAWEAARVAAGVVPRPQPASDDRANAAPPAPAEEPPASPKAQPATVATPAPPVEEAEEAKPAHARFWLGVAGALDVVLMPAANDACKLTANLTPAGSGNEYCTNPDGTDFPSAAQNAHLTMPGAAGRVDGGLRAGDIRVMLALDAAVTDNILFGVRFGYAFGAYTGTAAIRDGRSLGAKVHAEVRGTYVFGRDPLGREGFAPTAFVGGGFSEFDAQTDATVTLDNVAGAQAVRVWITAAPYFVTAGGGARYQFSPRIELTAAARIQIAFGGGFALPTFGPELTLQYGL